MIDMNNNKGRLVLAGSVALNIFLVAFVAGRISMQEMMPPPPPPHAHADGMHGGPHGGDRFMDRGGKHYGDRFERGRRGGDRMRGDMRPPPPPMFGPGELLSPDEMRADMKAMKPNFDKVREERQAFAKKLAEGPVSKEDVLAHFKQVDGIMSGVRSQTQEKIAEKLSSLTPEQRERIAKRMERHGERRHMGPPPPPPGEMPDDVPPDGPPEDIADDVSDDAEE